MVVFLETAARCSVQTVSGRRDRPEERPRDTRCSGRPSSPQQPSTVEGPIRAVTARGTKARGCRIRPASERGLLTDSTCTGCDRVHVPGVADLLGILETAGASARQNGPQPYAALVGNPRPTTVCCTPKSGVFLQLTKARCAYPALFSWNQQPSLQPDHAIISLLLADALRLFIGLGSTGKAWRSAGTLERACLHFAWPCSTTPLLTVIKESRTLQACSCAVVQYFSGPRLL